MPLVDAAGGGRAERTDAMNDMQASGARGDARGSDTCGEACGGMQESEVRRETCGGTRGSDTYGDTQEKTACGGACGVEERGVGGVVLPARWKATVAVVWTGQAVSILSTYAATFAAMWYITETLASSLALAIAAVASLLPVAMLSPLGGAVADRWSRKAVMIVADGSAGVASLVLGAMVLTGTIEMWMLLVLLAARGTAQAFHSPALAATAPLMVPERHLVRINSLDQMLTSGAAIVSPAIGIFLYTTFGFAAVMFVDAAAALVACVCIALARIPQPSASASRDECGPLVSVLAHDVVSNVRLILSDRPLAALLGVCMAAMLLFTPLGTLFPLITYEWYQGDGYAASLVEAACGIGLLAGSVILLVHGGGRRLVPVVLGSGLVIACLVVAVSFLEGAPFPAFLVCATLIFVATGVFNGPIMPIMQKRLPQERMGKAMGIAIALSSWSAPVGLVLTGVAADALGIAQWFFVSGVVLAVLCVVGFASTGLRSLDDGAASDDRSTADAQRVDR